MFSNFDEEMGYEYGSRFDDIRERYAAEMADQDYGECPWVPEAGAELFGFNLVQVGSMAAAVATSEAWLAEQNGRKYVIPEDDIPF